MAEAGVIDDGNGGHDTFQSFDFPKEMISSSLQEG
jgi:hypothetical protein